MKQVFFPSLLALCSLIFGANSHAEQIFVSGSGSNYITEIDEDGNVSALATNPHLKNAYAAGMAMDSNGNLYTSSNRGRQISEFSSSGAFLGSDSINRSARRLAFDSAGNMYVGTRGGRIVEFLTDGKKKIVASHFGRTSFAIGANGNLFVTSSRRNSITEISHTGEKSTVTFTGAPLCNPNGIAFDSTGNIFVVNMKGKNGPSIEEITDGVGRIFATAGLNMPKSLAVDAEGNVYVTDSGNNTVTEYNSAGALVHTFTGFKDPCSIVISDDAPLAPNLPTDPTPIPAPGSPGSGPGTVAVPEPSTYVLVISGAALFFVLRRRHKLAKD